MSKEITAETNGPRSFEDRVFARFDSLESRIERLEMKQYDTKPIWEHMLVAIEHLETKLGSVNIRFDSLEARFDAVEKRFDGVHQRFDAVDQHFDAVDQRFDAVDKRFETLNTDIDNGLRGVERKIDVLNQYILDLRADQRYVDSRLEKIESQSKPSLGSWPSVTLYDASSKI